MPTLDIRAFQPGDLDDAARLLAARHAAHRRDRPGLDPRWEDPATGRGVLAELAAAPGASGVVARDGSTVTGYLLGVPRDDAIWGPNIWVEAAGHAVAEPALVRDLYAVAARTWVEAGHTDHYVVAPATDRALIKAWFSLDFGQQHLHAMRPVPEPGWQVASPPGVTIRLARREDLTALAELELVLPQHLGAAPVFSRLPVPTLDEVRAELEKDFGDERYTTFVAEHEARVIGTALACSVEMSSMHAGLARPVDAGFLGYAAVLPEARDRGAGRALGETVLAWARDAGYRWVVTDWRSANIGADRAWRSLGFEPLFRRLHRTIA